MDADTGAVLFEKHADARSLIASTTKIMTALVALEHCDPEDEFTVPPEATGIEGSSMYLKAWETLSIRALLYGLMLQSGNDAAVALALACSGSVSEFVALMNLKAQKLHLTNTHFENPNGLDSPQHYSTARDLATLTRCALKNDTFAQIVATKSVRLGDRCLTNHNKLLWSLDGALGVKTGYTRAAGRVLVSAAEREGRRLIAVTIHDGNDWADHRALYEDGFAAYQTRRVVGAGETVARMTLPDGTTARLRAAQSLEYAARAEETVRIVPQISTFSAGEAGAFAGTGAVWLGERKIATVRLLWDGLEEEDGGTLTENHLGARADVPTPCRGADRAGAGVGQ